MSLQSFLQGAWIAGCCGCGQEEPRLGSGGGHPRVSRLSGTVCLSTRKIYPDQCCGALSEIRCLLTPGSGPESKFFLYPGSPTHISGSSITILWHQNTWKKISVLVLKEISFISFNFVKFMATKRRWYRTSNFFSSRVVIGSGIEYKSGSGWIFRLRKLTMTLQKKWNVKRKNPDPFERLYIRISGHHGRLYS